MNRRGPGAPTGPGGLFRYHGRQDLKTNEDLRVHDLAYSATTDDHKLLRAFEVRTAEAGLTVIFSTYQSLAEAQGLGSSRPIWSSVMKPPHDRATLAGEEASHFVRVYTRAFSRLANAFT